MNNKKIFKTLFFVSILAMLAFSVFGAGTSLPPTVTLGAPFPTGWVDNITIHNYTQNDTAPEFLNFTRGFIYDINISVGQQTHRWIGYVGNITGNVTLGDNAGNNLYQWDLAITSGEIYATRFHGTQVTNPGSNQVNTGVENNEYYQYIDWSTIKCANQTSIDGEAAALDHNDTIDNDALNVTFTNSSAFLANAFKFHAGATYINPGDAVTENNNCSGAFLLNGTGTNNQYWQMVVLEDGFTDGVSGDLLYAAIIEDDAVGFNGNNYDFQIMLPQYGQVLNTGNAQGDVKENIAYYFYLELVGEGWPNNNP